MVIIFCGPIFDKISLIPEQCVGVLVWVVLSHMFPLVFHLYCITNTFQCQIFCSMLLRKPELASDLGWEYIYHLASPKCKWTISQCIPHWVLLHLFCFLLLLPDSLVPTILSFHFNACFPTLAYQLTIVYVTRSSGKVTTFFHCSVAAICKRWSIARVHCCCVHQILWHPCLLCYINVLIT